MSLIAEIKAASRSAIHDHAAVDAVYQDKYTDPANITVRWHTKLQRSGALEGGYDVEIIEGINRLVFNETNLAEATSVADGSPQPVTLRKRGSVTIPEWGVTFSLDTLEDPDGPLSIYWSVVKEGPGYAPTPVTGEEFDFEEYVEEGIT